MQREHKYRYWYGGKMLEVGQIEFFTDGQIIVNGELTGGILLEWTGLKDKNGVEIYEGDVVKAGNPNYNFEVRFEQGCFGVLDRTATLNPFWQIQSVEVLGNIYQTPELLN